MSIKNMHYDFKMKFNKIDSQNNRNLLVPEIDWLLNQAANLFVSIIAEPRLKKQLGFETNQRTIDDIRAIVVSNDNNWLPVASNSVALPIDYWYFVKGNVRMTKGTCNRIKARVHIKQHDDMFEESSFNNSSFEWREVNALFYDGGLKFFTDGTFTINDFCINYIRKMTYMHNAEAFRVGGYKLPNGQILTGFSNCELPETTHSEIVDIAVLLAAGQIQTSDYPLKMEKLNINQII
jgi:hypothetical protein